MRITNGIPNLLRESITRADAAAGTVATDPVKGMTGLMQSENGVKMASKLIKAKDEMLGTILDMKA